MVPLRMLYRNLCTGVTDQVCAECKHLTTKTQPGLMGQGKGECTGYGDGYVKLRDPIVPWNQRGCVLFQWARDMEPRKRWMEKCKAREAGKKDNSAHKRTTAEL